MALSKSTFKFYAVMMQSKLFSLKITLILFIKKMKILKNWLHYLFTVKKNKHQSKQYYNNNCCNNCAICKNYMIFDNTFICTVTGKSYWIRDRLNCESINVIYLITFSKCLEQYVGSTVKFKTRFRIHKSDIETKKERCGSARHFNSKCYHDTNLFQYLKVQLVEQIHYNNLENIRDILWNRKK